VIIKERQLASCKAGTEPAPISVLHGSVRDRPAPRRRRSSAPWRSQTTWRSLGRKRSVGPIKTTCYSERTCTGRIFSTSALSGAPWSQSQAQTEKRNHASPAYVPQASRSI